MLSPNTPDLCYRRLTTKGRHLRGPGAPGGIRIAILSDAASQQFVPVLRALFNENGLTPDIFEGAFDSIEIEVLNPRSELYAFQPEIIILASSVQALRTRYFQSPDDNLAARTLERLENIWTAIRAQTAAHIIQFNYAMPYERFFGSYDLQVPQSLYSATLRLNACIADAARRHTSVTLVDIDAISSNIGRASWFDDRLWNMTKAFCMLEYLPVVCQNIVEIVRALIGRIVKCLVLDLDGTVWGGTVGEDGHLGIEIAAHGDGEAFYNFQHYLRSLKMRGIILAVCSKNDPANALRPFSDNPQMVLRRNDIAVFIANWENKADNIRIIRERLNIGYDAMVFLDDNPFERGLVRQLLPEVIVPELPEDPADFVRCISSLNLFETTSYSAEDSRRADQYKEEADRLELRASMSDIGEYLRSLDMRIRVGRFDPPNLSRIAQLIQRSNQFNLTTRRLNEEACRRLMLDEEECMPLCAILSDRCGEQGLISIVILQFSGEVMTISDWLMSCRVLARGVEEYLMNYVIDIALQKNIRRINAMYIPTAKNSMVKDFFAQFGFLQVGAANGSVHWTLDPVSYQPAATVIQEG